jgi:hypothetical protein
MAHGSAGRPCERQMQGCFTWTLGTESGKCIFSPPPDFESDFATPLVVAKLPGCNPAGRCWRFWRAACSTCTMHDAHSHACSVQRAAHVGGRGRGRGGPGGGGVQRRGRILVSPPPSSQPVASDIASYLLFYLLSPPRPALAKQCAAPTFPQ